jgi:periplasmic divalent cation tolerance protein
MQAHVRIVLCTVPNEGVAETLARSLLEERLAACVNLVPGVRSIYRWQGEIEDDRELLLVIKTQADCYERLEQHIRALHPYQVCEVLALDVAAGSQPYLDWLLSETLPSRA